MANKTGANTNIPSPLSFCNYILSWFFAKMEWITLLHSLNLANSGQYRVGHDRDMANPFTDRGSKLGFLFDSIG